MRLESGGKQAALAAYILLAIAIIRFWIMPLGSSFWGDELGTLWTIRDGPLEFFSHFREFPSSPPAYSLISWLAYVVGGAHEYVLRLPSVLSLALACVLLYRLMARLAGKETALPAVVAFVCLRPVIFAATDARPYAVLLLVIVGSTLALVRWLDSGLPRDAAVYAVTAALIPYFHYLGTPVWGVHAIYAAARFREGCNVRTRHLGLVALAVAVLATPMIWPLFALIRSRGQHVFLKSPGMPALAEYLAPSGLVFGLSAGLMAAWIVSKEFSVRSKSIRRSAFCLMVAMALVPALLGFAVSVLTSTKIFNERYIIATFAGIAMVAGWGIGQIEPRAARFIVLCSVVVVALGCFGYSRRLWPPHNDENWRDAMAAVRRAAGASRIPVLIKSTFPESSTRKFDYTGKLPGWLIAPLVLYPAGGHVFPVARTFDSATISYLETSVAPAIDREGRYILVLLGPDEDLTNWLSGRFAGPSAHSLGDFDSVTATLYERTPGTRNLNAP